jgi:hypothetical protein
MGDVLSCLRAHGGKVNDLSHILFLDKKSFCLVNLEFSCFVCMSGKIDRLAESSEAPSFEP